MERLQTTTTTNNKPQTYYIHKQAISEVGNMLQAQIKKTTNYNKHKPQKLFLLDDVMYLPKIWLSWVRDCFPTLLSRLKGYMDIDSGWWHRKIFCSRNKWTHLALQPNNMNFNFIKQYILHKRIKVSCAGDKNKYICIIYALWQFPCILYYAIPQLSWICGLVHSSWAQLALW